MKKIYGDGYMGVIVYHLYSEAMLFIKINRIELIKIKVCGLFQYHYVG